MPKPRVVEPFHLIITNQGRRMFNVVGPMTDDTEWNSRVCAAQEQGREVNCYAANRSLTREQIIAQTRKRLGFTLSDQPLI